jgi:hypothetical protein
MASIVALQRHLIRLAILSIVGGQNLTRPLLCGAECKPASFVQKKSARVRLVGPAPGYNRADPSAERGRWRSEEPRGTPDLGKTARAHPRGHERVQPRCGGVARGPRRAPPDQRRHVQRPGAARIQSGDRRGARPGFAGDDRVDRGLQVRPSGPCYNRFGRPDNGPLRHIVFVALREDKPANEVRASGRGSDGDDSRA